MGGVAALDGLSAAKPILWSLKGLRREDSCREGVAWSPDFAALNPGYQGHLRAPYLIASGLTGEPTAPVIGIAGATNMNS
jgi:hypothetical protein